MASNTDDIISYDYRKRSGTSGIRGQLYETKLLSLILLRALWDDNIKDFVLGTNMADLGAFDGIVFRYETKDSQKSKMIFLQAKHKDDPSKYKLNVTDLYKQNGDFMLLKYLESYLQVKQKFAVDKNNIIFKNLPKDMRFEFIIYTPAKEQFNKKKILKSSDEESFIKSREHSKAFQFAYDDYDVEILVSAVGKHRATLLAKCLCKFIIKDNLQNMLECDLIKTFHVYLAQNVMTVDSADAVSADSDKTHSIGKFRESFWRSEDDYLSHIRGVICKELAANRETSSATSLQNEVENAFQARTFNLPINFGNHNFRIYRSKKKQQRRFDYLCSVFHKLLRNDLCRESLQLKYIIIKLEDDSVGPGKIIQANDLENYRLAGLVGNLLIYDNETEMLKFNLAEQSLPSDVIRVLYHLKETYDLSLYRFDINVHGFPKLTFYCKERDRKLIIDFLSQLVFYTNQAKEDEVEYILKQEIEKYLNTNHKQLDALLTHVLCEAIFLKVHDEVQKWWKEPYSSPYLTKSCTLYQKAERELLSSSMINIIHFITCEKIRQNLLEFEYESVAALEIDSFLKSDKKILIILSEEVDFSSKKVVQYYDNKERGYLFIDLDLINFENCFDIMKIEIECASVSVLVLLIQRDIESNSNMINYISNSFKGQIIIISPCRYEDHLKMAYIKSSVVKDARNNFSSLSIKLREIIFNERRIIFQGLEVDVHKIFNEKSLNILSPRLLRILVDNNKLKLGSTLINTLYNETIHYYTKQNVCRYILFKETSTSVIDYLRLYPNVSFDALNNTISLPNHKSDIILTSDSPNMFDEICERHNDHNIHWFMTHVETNSKIWKQTHGSLRNLMEYVYRETHEHFTLQLNTFKDIKERVVIVSAEPGMGKSTLLSHLTINTKRLHPSLWILRINLLNKLIIDKLSDWKEYETNINLIEAIFFLYDTTLQDCERNILRKETFYELVTVNNNNEIIFNDIHDKYLPGVDLSEIKLLNYFYNENRLVVVFDGFDEICPDYTNEVIQLLLSLKASKIAHLWVTSRQYNVLQQLESALGTFSFTLQSMTQLQQKQFLHNVWSHNLDLDPCDAKTNKMCETYVERFYSSTSSMFNDDKGKFLSSPLHMSMIAEIYQDSFKEYLKGKLSHEYKVDITDTNLNTVYEQIIDKKFFAIRFGDKKPSMNLKDPDIRKIVDKERKLFIEKHKIIAAYMLLDKNVVLSECDIKNMHDFIEDIKAGEEKTGIIECIVGDMPKFIHLTFAEYFAVEYIFDKIMFDCTATLWEYFVVHILTFGKNGIRRFINSKLQKDLIHLASNSKRMQILFDTMISQGTINTPYSTTIMPTTAMHVAVTESLHYISMFLLKSAKSAVNKNNLTDFIKYITRTRGHMCVLCNIIYAREVDLLEFIFEIITDVDYTKLKDLFHCQDIKRFNPFINALSDKQMADITFNVLQHDPDLIVELFTLRHENGIVETAAHYLGRNKYIHFCWEYLLKLTEEQRIQIFNVKNLKDQLPLHYAAKENYYDFFTAMDDLLGRKEFQKLCKTADETGFTPICTLPYDQRYFDKLKDVIVKVYELPDVDLDDFLFNKLPKLHPKRRALI